MSEPEAERERWHFELLRNDHDASAFDCGKPSDNPDQDLSRWIRQYARSTHKKGNAKVYAAVRPGERTVLAYYAITPTGLPLDKLTIEERRGLPNPMPGWLIARMAVQRDFRGRGYGGTTLANCLARIERLAAEGGGAIVVVDPIDDEAASFYRHYEFTEHPAAPGKLALSMKRLTELKIPPAE